MNYGRTTLLWRQSELLLITERSQQPKNAAVLHNYADRLSIDKIAEQPYFVAISLKVLSMVRAFFTALLLYVRKVKTKIKSTCVFHFHDACENTH